MNSNPVHQYFYLWIVAIIVPLWALIFYRKKASRIEIIYMGLLMGTCAMGLDRYCSFHDYWRPPTVFRIFNFESFLYGFFWGGISAKIFELLFGREYRATGEPNPVFVLIFVFASFLLYMVLLGLFNVNSVDNYIILMLLCVIVLLFLKKELFIVSVVSGVCMVVVNMCWYAVILAIYPEAVDNIWRIENISGLSVFGVPIEEHAYIFFMGCFGSILYKAATRPNGATVPTMDDRPTKGQYFLQLMRPYRVPLFFLFLVVGRMVLFGEALIPIGKIFDELRFFP